MPASVQHVGAADGLGQIESLIGVDHDVEILAHRVAHGAQAGAVLGDGGLADLQLRAREAPALHLGGVLGQRLGGEVQPAAFGRVERHRRFRPPRHPPERQPRAAAAQIPERGVDGGQRQRGDRAHRRRVGHEQQIAPDPLDLLGLAPEKARHKRPLQQADHRGAAGADGIGIARRLRPRRSR
jgi:hypothetical protein